jgi:hypothetical protein
MEHNPLENIQYKESVEKFRNFGDLGVTAEDHLNLASTPDKELEENPGKTLGEIWDDEKIRKFLGDLKEFISTEQDTDVMKRYQKQQQANFESTVSYLKSIDKLPEGFE